METQDNGDIQFDVNRDGFVLIADGDYNIVDQD